MNDRKVFRLITRHDFDGLVSAILLKELGIIEEIEFAHPKDMQDGKIAVGDGDITTNLPFVDGAHLAFDHHLSEASRVGRRENYVLDPDAPSASQVVFKYFGGESKFPEFTREMMAAVNKADAARFTREDIFRPRGWILLHFLLDPRTGLGRFRKFAKTDKSLMIRLADYCRKHPISKVMGLYDIAERSDRYFVLEEKFKDQIRKCATLHGKTVVLDLREEDPILAGNRFMAYALFPESNISIHVMWGKERRNTVFAVGKSIFDRSSSYNVGLGMLQYGGGGHEGAGTCQIPNDEAEDMKAAIIRDIANRA